MRTYQTRAACVLAALVALSTPAAAQQRRYLLEVSGGGAYMHFDNATNLKPAFGGVGRIGLWLPLRFSIEGEALFTSPRTTVNGFGWSSRLYTGSLLANIAVGSASSVFLRAGYGTSKYSSDRCDTGISFVDIGPCGSTSALIAGLGFRAAISPTLMLRVDGSGNRSSTGHLTNFGGAFGLSVMLGSKPRTDRDKDGVYDPDDHCPNTPAGVLVDRRGCPSDTDKDGVADGLDRCPATAPGTPVDAAGCPRDTDHDGVADSMDRCADTPAGATVDPAGCPVDSDRDGVADGLDRCPDTPAGATVDQLGCPGDEDGDGVLDGLDQCPHTPAGASVNSLGCPPTITPPNGRERAGADSGDGRPVVLRTVGFVAGTARLRAKASPALDSLARALVADPALSIEVGAHTDDAGGPNANLALSRARAEAVRQYLIAHKVPAARVTAKGYGTTARLSRAGTVAARAANRRIEIRALTASPAR